MPRYLNLSYFRVAVNKGCSEDDDIYGSDPVLGNRAVSTLHNGLLIHVLLFRPVRSKTETNLKSVAHIFPLFPLATCICLELNDSPDFLCPFWLVRMITLILVYDTVFKWTALCVSVSDLAMFTHVPTILEEALLDTKKRRSNNATCWHFSILALRTNSLPLFPMKWRSYRRFYVGCTFSAFFKTLGIPPFVPFLLHVVNNYFILKLLFCPRKMRGGPWYWERWNQR